jgi:PPOX class probable F420-dependent enzyme
LPDRPPHTAAIAQGKRRESIVAANQGDLELVNDPVAQQLLQAPLPARLAYTWHDGTPRVVPIWFHWTGEEVVMAGPPDAPKVDAIRARPEVALTIDGTEWPYKVLLIRGTAAVDVVDGAPPEYAAAARKYFGATQGDAWAAQVGQMMSQTARIAVRPTWVGVLDFETRFPSALARRMG